MKFQFASYRLQHLPAPPTADDIVFSLAVRFRELGYDEQNLGEIIEEHGDRNQALVAILRNCANRADQLSILVQLFLLSLNLDRDAVFDALGEELAARLLFWGLMAEAKGKVAATVDIHPCRGSYLVTDHGIGPQRQMDAVYPLGGDSHILARLAPRKEISSALDLATGSGVHAILAAQHSQLVHAVDLSPRAIDFSRFNSYLNQVSERLDLFQGDLFEALPEQKYDLIVSNLPWVPTPNEPSELYRSGGVDGEVLVRKVFESTHSRLNAGGWLVMYVEYPKFATETYLERVEQWLGEGAWGLVLLNIKHWSTGGYVMSQVATHTQEELLEVYDRWMKSYEAAGIEGMAWAMVYAKKLDPNRVSWRVEAEADFPPAEEPEWVSQWLEQLDEAHNHQATSGPSPTLCPSVEFWLNESSGKGKLSWPDRCLKDVDTEPGLAQLIRKLEQGGSLGQESLEKLRSLGILKLSR